jgi:predicted anti-sigma-YlaC factor YlaD
VNVCPRPLDPLDTEALASGAEPPYAADAAAHAALCGPCGAAVERASGLLEALEALSRQALPFPDLAPRVTRLRPFSRRERRTYALWRTPILLCAGLALPGLALVAAPALTAGEQAGLAAALLASVLAFVRAAASWASDLAWVAPPALEALAEALRQDRSLGLASLLLLFPSAFGLRWVFARARGRR